YAFRDTAYPTISMISQWLALNKAKSAREIKTAVAQHRGTRWLTTVAADRHGEVFYGDLSAVPDTSNWTRLTCAPSLIASYVSLREKIIVLNGNRAESLVASARIRAPHKMPVQLRTDYVLNCNDSHWLVNAQAPLTGFPGFVGREQVAQSLRTRM